MVKQITKICEWCGREFTAKTKLTKTCSSECSHALATDTCRKRDNFFKRVYEVDDYFLQRESPEKYYFLGLMASDGNVTANVGISQSKDVGKPIIYYVKDILKTTYPVYESKTASGNTCYSLSIRSPQLKQDLIANGITPRKTLTFKIPEYVLQDENKLRNFLIGYIDGDGCIGVYTNMLSISFACSIEMGNQLMVLPLFKQAKLSRLSGGNIRQVGFNGIKAIHFGEWLYKNICVYKSHKYQKYLNYMEHRYEISERLFLKEQKEKIFEYLDKRPETTSGELQKIFNISKSKSYSYKCKWRKKNGYI